MPNYLEKFELLGNKQKFNHFIESNSKVLIY